MNKTELETLYQKLEKKQIEHSYENEIDQLKGNIVELNDEIDILKYRIACVDRVLDHVRIHPERFSPHDMSKLLTHCCNKLNGNIDSIVLDLGGKE